MGLVSVLQPVLQPIILPALGEGVGGGEPSIRLSASTIAEDATVGTVIGTLSVLNGSGSYTFSITADIDAKFAVDGDGLETAAELDFETGPSHSVTIEADNGIDDPLTQEFLIAVTDVDEYVPDPPTSVEWGSAADDTTPDFDFDLPPGAAAGDVLVAQVSDDGADDWSDYFRHTLIQDDIDTDAITINGLTPRDEGDYDFRFRIERGAAVSSWSATIDVTINFAPTISSLSPADNATGVAVAANLVATFNKSVQFGTGSIDLYDADDDLIESFDVTTDVGAGAGQVSISGAVLTINPTASLEANKGHYVQIDATAIENLDDVTFAGIADKTTWNFTSVAAVLDIAGQTQGGIEGNTTLPVIVPTSVVAGDIMLVLWTGPVTTVPGTPSGWTREVFTQLDFAQDISGALYWKIADSTDASNAAGGTAVTNIVHASAVAHAYRAFRITGGQDVEATIDGNSATSWNPNPPSLTPSWGSAGNLWIAAFGHTRSALRTVSAYPTGYTDDQTNTTPEALGSPAATRIGFGSASKIATASSDDPAAYTLSATGTAVAFTIAVRPA